ncbi:MAG: hypothetical protein QGH37_20145 [Candidatus Poribacteria bacterium]|nr:hypothetical protein [Candidatus Poribacteria bacterium]
MGITAVLIGAAQLPHYAAASRVFGNAATAEGNVGWRLVDIGDDNVEVLAEG